MGIGDSLKKWGLSKATEMLTADSGKREGAAASADAAEQQAKDDVGEKLLRTAFPKVGEWADKQEADKVARAQARDQKERDEIAALPLADVQLAISGETTGQWSGRLHLAWKDVAPDEPDSEYLSPDPYATRPKVWLELFAEDTALPAIGGRSLRHWSIQIPGYTGDGTYDLTAIAREQEAAGASPPYEECGMDFAEADDSSFYFYADAGQSTLTVAEDGKRISATIAMTGAIGDLEATSVIVRS